MSRHTEISFETEVCEHLATHGWLYAEKDNTEATTGIQLGKKRYACRTATPEAAGTIPNLIIQILSNAIGV